MMSFYYQNQNPSGVSFLVQIRFFVTFFNLAGITKFKYERKNNKDHGVMVVKWKQMTYVFWANPLYK